MQQLLFGCVYFFASPFGQLPPALNSNQVNVGLWLIPRVGGCFAAGVAWLLFRRTSTWGVFFGCFFAVFLLATWDAATPDVGRTPEESLVTFGPPFVLGLAALIAAILSAIQKNALRSNWWHWAGILVSLLPLLWFSYWWVQDYIQPRDWFVRIRE